MLRADKNDTDEISSIADLALLFTTGFYIAETPIQRLKTPHSEPFWVRHEIDGWVQDRTYLSVLSWRALMPSVLLDPRIATVGEVGGRGRLRAPIFLRGARRDSRCGRVRRRGRSRAAHYHQNS